MPSRSDKVRELEYDEYQTRQFEEINPAQLEKRAQTLRIGHRAIWGNGTWTPAAYPGFAMQAMLHESSNAAAISVEMQHMQQELSESVRDSGTLYPLPAASFHQTVANTFSSDRLNEHIVNQRLLDSFPQIIGEAIASQPALPEKEPVRMRMIGIGIFRTAIGLLGTFDNPGDFQRILDFRDFLYSHEKLAQIGLKRTRPFIGHLTLAYIESELSDESKKSLVHCIADLNAQISKQSLIVEMPCARLHYYENLSAFHTKPTFPNTPL